ERLKYGPIERITGVFAFAGRFDGRRMSVCSFTPSVESIVASDQVAPSGTSAAIAVAGTPQSAATMTNSAAGRRQSENIRILPMDTSCKKRRPVYPEARHFKRRRPRERTYLNTAGP